MPENGEPIPVPASGKDLLGLVEQAGSHVEALRIGLDEAQRQEFMGIVGAAIAHEINNVLTPVRGYAEAALARPGDRDLADKALRMAANGSSRACAIADAILDCANGAVDGFRSGVAAAVVRAVDLLGPGPSPFHVEHHLASSLEVGISPVAFEQIILNLLLNARAAGARRVVVSGRVSGEWGIVEFKDDGKGIGEERLARILRGPVSGGGRGLGLTICRYLVESAGGKISAASQAGAGACFTIELPRAQRVAKAA